MERSPLFYETVWAAAYAAAYANGEPESAVAAAAGKANRAVADLRFAEANPTVRTGHHIERREGLLNAQGITSWTLAEIEAAWYQAQETGRPAHERARDPDDLRNSWEHMRAALMGEEA